MTTAAVVDDLPLLWSTPARWAEQVLAKPLVLLNDHAHLEKKAAANALELLNRWPEPSPPEHWVRMMTAIARDEVEHLSTVTRLLARHGGRLTRSHRNPYAADMRALVRWGKGLAILAEHCEDDKQLARLYKNLYASEAGHYRVFIELAEGLPDRPSVESRWRSMLKAEAKTIQAQKCGVGMHSGVE